jgi:hypothetical protein
MAGYPDRSLAARVSIPHPPTPIAKRGSSVNDAAPDRTAAGRTQYHRQKQSWPINCVGDRGEGGVD